MITDAFRRKLHYRAHHRGTREADAIVGGFYDAYSVTWTRDDFAWFEKILDEQDVDIMGWALGTIAIPPEFAGPMMDAMCQLDYIKLPRGLEPNG